MSSESISPLRPVGSNIGLPAMAGPAGIGRRDPRKNAEQKKRKKEEPLKDPELEGPDGRPGDGETAPDDGSEPRPTVDCYG